MGLLRLGVAALIWMGADPHAERICRHAWPDVLVLKGDEESLSITVQSTRFSHPYVQWVFVFSGCCSSGKKSLQNDLEADPSTVARVCVSLIHDKWSSVRVAFLLENSLTPSPLPSPSPPPPPSLPDRPASPEVVLFLIPCALVMGMRQHLLTRRSFSSPSYEQ